MCRVNHYRNVVELVPVSTWRAAAAACPAAGSAASLEPSDPSTPTTTRSPWVPMIPGMISSRLLREEFAGQSHSCDVTGHVG